MLRKLLAGQSKRESAAIFDIIEEAVEDENYKVVQNMLDGRLRINQMPGAANPYHE